MDKPAPHSQSQPNLSRIWRPPFSENRITNSAFNIPNPQENSKGDSCRIRPKSNPYDPRIPACKSKTEMLHPLDQNNGYYQQLTSGLEPPKSYSYGFNVVPNESSSLVERNTNDEHHRHRYDYQRENIDPLQHYEGNQGPSTARLSQYDTSSSQDFYSVSTNAQNMSQQRAKVRNVLGAYRFKDNN